MNFSGNYADQTMSCVSNPVGCPESLQISCGSDKDQHESAQQRTPNLLCEIESHSLGIRQSQAIPTTRLECLYCHSNDGLVDLGVLNYSRITAISWERH